MTARLTGGDAGSVAMLAQSVNAVERTDGAVIASRRTGLTTEVSTSARGIPDFLSHPHLGASGGRGAPRGLRTGTGVLFPRTARAQEGAWGLATNWAGNFHRALGCADAAASFSLDPPVILLAAVNRRLVWGERCRGRACYP